MSDLINKYFGDINNITIDETRTERPNFPIDIDTRYKIYKKKFNDDDDDDDNYELVEINNNLILLDMFRTDSFCEDGVTQAKHYTFSFYKVDDNNIKKIEESPLDFWNDDDYEDHQITIHIDTCSEKIEDFIKIDDDHTVYQSEYGLNSLAGGKTKKTKQHRRKTMKRKTKKGGKQNKTKGIARRRRRRQIEK
jgi:hypothetical protein